LTVADATDVHTTRTTPSITRTVVAGLAGGVAFILGNVLTFGLLGGARRGQQGLLFDPDTQSPKVITVWKVLRPLPRIIDTPALILVGLLMFGIGYAVLCARWIGQDFVQMGCHCEGAGEAAVGAGAGAGNDRRGHGEPYAARAGGRACRRARCPVLQRSGQGLVKGDDGQPERAVGQIQLQLAGVLRVDGSVRGGR
jgi:hypothetical protein